MADHRDAIAGRGDALGLFALALFVWGLGVDRADWGLLFGRLRRAPAADYDEEDEEEDECEEADS